MEVATRLQLLDRHAGRGQDLGVGDAFVAQGIELGRRDERRRQAVKSPAQGEARGSLRSAGAQWRSQNQHISERVRK